MTTFHVNLEARASLQLLKRLSSDEDEENDDEEEDEDEAEKEQENEVEEEKEQQDKEEEEVLEETEGHNDITQIVEFNNDDANCSRTSSTISSSASCPFAVGWGRGSSSTSIVKSFVYFFLK